MMIHIDYGVTDDCININSYGEICVRCGCCSRYEGILSPRERTIRKIRYYRQRLQEQYAFDGWIEPFRKIQERNIALNVLYCKRQIRKYRKVLRTLR